MKKLYLLGGIMFFMMSSIMLLAQNRVDDQGNPNDPGVNDRANACYTDGSLGGACDTDWKWVCGWGIIRMEYGLVPRAALSELCQSLLAPLPTNEPDDNNGGSSSTNTTSLPPLPTFTLTAGSTNTPTNTPTDTPIGPTDTPTNTPTETVPAPTDTATNTPTETVPAPTDTATNTPTIEPPTPTPTYTSTP